MKNPCLEISLNPTFLPVANFFNIPTPDLFVDVDPKYHNGFEVAVIFGSNVSISWNQQTLQYDIVGPAEISRLPEGSWTFNAFERNQTIVLRTGSKHHGNVPIFFLKDKATASLLKLMRN